MKGASSGTETILKGSFGSEVRVILNVTLGPPAASLVLLLLLLLAMMLLEMVGKAGGWGVGGEMMASGCLAFATDEEGEDPHQHDDPWQRF